MPKSNGVSAMIKQRYSYPCDYYHQGRVLLSNSWSAHRFRFAFTTCSVSVQKSIDVHTCADRRHQDIITGIDLMAHQPSSAH